MADPGEGPGGPGPPLFFAQNEARRPENNAFGDRPPPPLSQGLDDRPPPLIRRSGSATVPEKKGLYASSFVSIHSLFLSFDRIGQLLEYFNESDRQQLDKEQQESLR